MKNKKAFTLIELIAVIVILAIIALIAVPNINGYIKTSKQETFKTSVNSLINAYRYKTIDEDNELGRVSACSLDVEKCNLNGYLDKCDSESDKICIYLTNGNYCAVGDSESYNVKDGNCTNGNETPIITDISIINITTSSATVYVSFTEKGLVLSHRYRLLDSNNNVVSNWSDGDSIDNSSDNKVSKKIYNGLDTGKTYKVEVEIKNTNENNNVATISESFTTLSFARPEITYNTSIWETKKNVTITYQNKEGMTRKYRILDNTRFDITGFKDADIIQNVEINKADHYVDAKATSGSVMLNRTTQIGYVDNENDVNNTKPTSQVLNYRNSSRINTNEVSVKISDTLSGVAYYCISTTNKSSNCSGTGTNAELNKWVLAVNASDIAKVGKETREKTLQHQFANAGTYYVFVKDAVGNISDANPFTVYKVEYDLNGGTSAAIPHQIKLKDNTLVLTDVVPVRDGYDFIGWDTNPTKTYSSVSVLPTYSTTGDYTSNSNVKLYAQWRKTITITYNGNLGTGSLDNSVCYRYNAEETCKITFRNNGYTRTGYTFGQIIKTEL